MIRRDPTLNAERELDRALERLSPEELREFYLQLAEALDQIKAKRRAGDNRE